MGSNSSVTKVDEEKQGKIIKKYKVFVS